MLQQAMEDLDHKDNVQFHFHNDGTKTKKKLIRKLLFTADTARVAHFNSTHCLRLFRYELLAWIMISILLGSSFGLIQMVYCNSKKSLIQ